MFPDFIALRLASDTSSKPGTYVSADGDKPSNQMIANRKAIGPWEIFSVTRVTESVVALKTSSGSYVQVHNDNKLYPTGSDANDPTCNFRVEFVSGSQNVTLLSVHNKSFWSVRKDRDNWLECSVSETKTAQDWETFHYVGINP